MTADLLTPDRILRRAELLFTRRLDGVGPGAHRSVRQGDGVELADLREYVPGDDVRSIDWNLTARTGVPHVRVYDADRHTTALVVVDRSASMGFGTARTTKEGLARELIGALAAMLIRRGDRIGGMLYSDSPIEGLPPRSGRRAALRLLQVLDENPPLERATGRLDLALMEADRVLRHRGLVVVVSDLLDVDASVEPLRRSTHRHEVIVAEIRDPRECHLPNVGPIVLEDPETGRQLEVDTRRRDVMDRFESAVAERRARTASAIVATGAMHLVVSTDRDWVSDLLEGLQRRKKARR